MLQFYNGVLTLRLAAALIMFLFTAFNILVNFGIAITYPTLISFGIVLSVPVNACKSLLTFKHG